MRSCCRDPSSFSNQKGHPSAALVTSVTLVRFACKWLAAQQWHLHACLFKRCLEFYFLLGIAQILWGIRDLTNAMKNHLVNHLVGLRKRTPGPLIGGVSCNSSFPEVIYARRVGFLEINRPL